MILTWDGTGERLYETGVKKGVLYPYGASNTTKFPIFSSSETYAVGDLVNYKGKPYKCKTAISTAGDWDVTKWDESSFYQPGVAWNGLSNVSENPSGADESPIYADDIKYLSLRSREEFGIGIEAYIYPDEWAECDGSAQIVSGAYIGQQTRKMFGFSYRTIIGNDVDLDDHGYKLHLVYGGTASPSERSYATVNDSPEAITFSWDVTTTPVEIEGFKPTACITIDSTKFVTEAQKAALKALEDALYGTATTDPYLPMPAEVITLLTPAG